MIALFASIFALGIGPLVYQTFGPMLRTDRIVSGFILLIIASTLFIEVLPNAFNEIGYLALILAFVGFIGPTIIEKHFSNAANKTHVLTTLLGILGLVLHATIDGAAIQVNQTSQHHENLTLAIILHRLPVGLTIWWLLRPIIGEKYALFTLLTMAAATAGGFFLSMQLTEYFSNTLFIAVKAFISGSLLHVVFHKPHADGCMHTSKNHSHHGHDSHAHDINHLSHSIDKSPSDFLSQLKSKMPDKWELLGMLFALVVMSFQHLYF